MYCFCNYIDRLIKESTEKKSLKQDLLETKVYSNNTHDKLLLQLVDINI